MAEKLNLVNISLAVGISFGIYAFFLGITSWLFDWGTEFVKLAGTFYIGYAPTFPGSIIGAVWAFFDFFIGTAIVVLVYNMLQKRKR